VKLGLRDLHVMPFLGTPRGDGCNLLTDTNYVCNASRIVTFAVLLTCMLSESGCHLRAKRCGSDR
jgi:hypothetical protein